MIFWDNDGVLVETEGLYFRATAMVMEERGLELTPDAYRQHFLVESSGLRALVPDASDAELHTLRSRRNGLYAALLASAPIAVDGVAETLAELDGRYIMGVVTSSLREHFDLIHARTGFGRHFRFVLASGDYAEPKPHPAPYQAAIAAAAAFGVKRAECVVIEDSLRGLTSAKAAGLTTWVVPGALTAPGDFVCADRVLSSIREVPRVLAETGDMVAGIA